MHAASAWSVQQKGGPLAKMAKRDEARSRFAKGGDAIDAPANSARLSLLLFLPPSSASPYTDSRYPRKQEQLTLYDSLYRSGPTPALACALSQNGLRIQGARPRKPWPEGR